MSGTFIDGIGDEVTIVIGVIIAAIIGIVSWRSTYVPDITDSNTDHLDEDLIRGSEEFVSEATGQRTFTTSQTHTRQRGTPTSNQTNQPEEPPANEPRNFPDSDNFTVRLKFMNDSERTATANLNETIGQFRRHNFPSDIMGQYRFIYQGQVLRDPRKTFRDYNVPGTAVETGDNIAPVIHCFFSSSSVADDTNRPSNASNQQEILAEEMNIGRYFLPLIGGTLMIIWYLCIRYTYLFTIQSIVSIVGLTLFYIVLCLNGRF